MTRRRGKGRKAINKRAALMRRDRERKLQIDGHELGGYDGPVAGPVVVRRLGDAYERPPSAR